MPNEGTVMVDMKSENVLVLWAKRHEVPGELTKLRYTLEVFADENALAEACKDDPAHYEHAEYYSVGDLWMRARSCRAFCVKERRTW